MRNRWNPIPNGHRICVQGEGTGTRPISQKRTTKRIAIIGTGMVGGALDRYFRVTHDILPGLYDPPKGKNDRAALRDADIIFVAVPTPFYLDGTGFDDMFIRAALDAIPPPGKTIVLKSTVPPGTTNRLQLMYPDHRLLFNPEFLTESTADRDMQYPKRQIIGVTPESERDASLVMELLPRAPYECVISAKEAEMVKYFGNAFYAVKVAFANQINDLCEELGVEYDAVAECAKADPWIGPQHLDIYYSGYRGYGGKCLPKDIRTLISFAEECGIDLTVPRAAEIYNNALLISQDVDIQWEVGSPRVEAVAAE